MSDQPKPHHCKIDYNPDTDQVIFTVTENANQSKPATGEWTAADSIITAMLEEQRKNPAWSKSELWGIERDIVPSLRLAINAAIAAEREKLMKLERDWHKVINEVLKCSPIPARDRADDQLEPPWEVIARIRQQLAAERELRETAQSNSELLHEAMLKADKQLREQLAAAREKVQTLVDALQKLQR